MRPGNSVRGLHAESTGLAATVAATVAVTIAVTTVDTIVAAVANMDTTTVTAADTPAAVCKCVRLSASTGGAAATGA